MEASDSDKEGAPSPLASRRFIRFSEGGSGLIWYEACAVEPDGRASLNQLHLTNQNLKMFQHSILDCKELAHKKNGFTPVYILQLTHSGRYSYRKPGDPRFLLQQDPLLQKDGDEATPIISDDELDNLQESFVQSALLARDAGFDGVDIKACHRYLISELLACHTREGKYGGSFENRSRFLLETIGKVKKVVGSDFIIASRFNAFDRHPYPYGFGVDQNDERIPDSTEPLELTRLLVEAGVDLLCNSVSNPYYRYPFMLRPFDKPAEGGTIPDEHPLISISRMFKITKEIQKAAGTIPVVGSGYSWLRQFLPNAGAANVADGSASMIGLGRLAFAYPDAPNDVLQLGLMKSGKCCVTCSKCTYLLRNHTCSGCAVRDSKIYIPYIKRLRNHKEA
jgi:2,4-dienoyl-CoA reductase-like NADH-dependent reductase (Old Yellow Enzyme family)